ISLWRSSRSFLIESSSTSERLLKPEPWLRLEKPWEKSPKRTASMNRATSRLVRWTWRQSMKAAPRTSRPATTRAAPRSGRPSATTNRKTSATSRISRQARPSTKRLWKWRFKRPGPSQPVLFHAPVERRAGEAELRGGEADIVAVLLQRLLDHLLLDPLEIEVVAHGWRLRGHRHRRGAGGGKAAREREIGLGEGLAVGEDD